MAAFAFNIKASLYAMLGVIINGFVIDALIEGINMQKEVTVISNKSQKIKEFIINDLDRGVTVYNGKGGYENNSQDIIVVIIGRREFIKLRNFIKEIDKDAFITVSNVCEVFGYGFKSIC